MRGRQSALATSAALIGLAAGVVLGATSLAPAEPRTPLASAPTSDLLLDQQVLLLVAGESSGDAAAARVQSARGDVVGRVRLSAALLTEGGRDTVAEVVRGTAPTPLTGSGLEQAGALLGAALDGSLTATQREEVLGGFAGADLVQVPTRPAPGVTTVLLVGAASDRAALDELARGLRTRDWNVLTSTA